MNDPTPAARPPAPALARAGMGARWLRFALTVVEPLSVTALFIFLLEKSWLRWPDPLIDFPKNLYIAWRLSAGDLLYEKVTNWYGPLSNLVEGAGFKIFGVGLDTMVWMNVMLTVGVLLLLRGIFGALGNRLSVWLGSVVFVVVFALSDFTPAGNYNFITPYISQATYTLAGLLLLLWALLRHLASARRRWLVVAGLGLAVAYLDKPEGLLAAAGALGIYLAAQGIYCARSTPGAADWHNAGRWLARAASWLAAGFFALWLPVFLFFWVKGGLAYALLATNYAPYTMVSGTFRHAIMNASVMREISGFDHPWDNFIKQSLTGGLLVALCAVMIVAARCATGAKFGHTRWWAWAIMAGAAGVVGVRLGEQANYWMGFGRALVFPVLLVALGAVAVAIRAAWQRRANFAHGLGVAVVGVAANLMFVRMILNGRINHYGFFMMPLAVLFWIHCMVVEAPRPRRDAIPAGATGCCPWCFPSPYWPASVICSRWNWRLMRTKLSWWASGATIFMRSRRRWTLPA